MSEGQLVMQVGKSCPSSWPVQEDPVPLHLSEQTSTQVWNASAGEVGHMPMQADKLPPGHSPAGLGVGGVGTGTGTGTGAGTGTGTGGGLQSLGSGPLMTRPVIFKFFTV